MMLSMFFRARGCGVGDRDKTFYICLGFLGDLDEAPLDVVLFWHSTVPPDV